MSLRLSGCRASEQQKQQKNSLCNIHDFICLKCLRIRSAAHRKRGCRRAFARPVSGFAPPRRQVFSNFVWLIFIRDNGRHKYRKAVLVFVMCAKSR